MAASERTPAVNGADHALGRTRGRFVPTFPTLWPHMLLGARSNRSLPFPFGAAHIRYYFLARYGIYDVARSWELQGREVLFPAYFHSVELDALLAAGVRPRFYPVHTGMRVDSEEVARLIGPQTAAVYLIHYGGFPGPVRDLLACCRERGVRLIEDAALGLLSYAGDRPLGSFGDAAVFCLYKTIPTPTGGAIVMPAGWPDRLAEPRPLPLMRASFRAANLMLLNFQMRGLVGTGRLRRFAARLGHPGPRTESPHDAPAGSTFDHRLIGIGVGPFARRVVATQDYAAIVRRRRSNYQHLAARLGSVLLPVFPELPDGVCPLFYAVQTPHRERLLQVLRSHRIEIGEFWPEQHPAIPLGAFPEVDGIRRTALWLPCHQDLDATAIDWLASSVVEALNQVS